MAERKPFILPKDIPIEQYPKPEVFLSEGKRIIDEAQKQGVILRVMGPLALHYYFMEQIPLYAKLERLGERYFTDIDYAGYGKHRNKCSKLLRGLGYECDVQTMAMTGRTRQIYYGGAVPMIDVFFDKLNYCHEVDYEGGSSSTILGAAGRHPAAEAADRGDQRQGPQGHRVPAHRGADIGEDDAKKINAGVHRQALLRRLGLLVHGHAAQPAQGEDAQRQRAGLSPTSSATTSRPRSTSSWRASRPSPRPRAGRSAPRRAPTRSGTTRASRTGETRSGRPSRGRPAVEMTGRGGGRPAGVRPLARLADEAATLRLAPLLFTGSYC